MAMNVALRVSEHNKKKVIIIFFIILLLLFMTIALFSYLCFSLKNNPKCREISKNFNNLVFDILDETSKNFNTLNILSDTITDNPSFIEIQNLPTLLGTLNSNNKIDYINIIYPDSNGYSYNYKTNELSVIQNFNDTCMLMVENMNQCQKMINQTGSLSLFVPVKNSNNNRIAALNLQTKSNIIKKIQKFSDKFNVNVYIVDQEGYIIYKNAQSSYNNISSIFDLKYFNLKTVNSKFFKSSVTRVVSDIAINSSLNLAYISSYHFPNSNFSIIMVIPKPYRFISWVSHYSSKALEVDEQNNFSYFDLIKSILMILCCLMILVTCIFFSIKLYRLFTKKTYKSIAKWALHDEVTDGFNKQKFYLEVSNSLLEADNDSKYALLYMKLHNFDLYNQMYDSIKANDILKDVSDNIKWFLEKNGLSARIMNDNFAIFYKYKNDDKLLNFIKNLTRAIGEYKISVKLTPVFGIYKIKDFTVPVENMIENANMALKSLVLSDGINYTYYNNDLILKFNKEKELESEMYYALNQGQFIFYLQPILRTSTQVPIGAEALVRWNHPENGLLMPKSFLNILNKDSFVTYLDQFVIEQICKLMSKWIAAGIDIIPISANVSGLNLVNPRFATMMKSMVDMYNIPANLIHFEFNESYIFENLQYVKNILSELKSYGFSLGLDNFGQSYSSISILNDFDFDYFKFDKEFMQKLIINDKGKNILKELNNLVKSSDIKTIAVGVETKEDYDFTKKAGFDFIQGFFNSRPMNITDFEFSVFRKSISNKNNEDM